MDYWFDEAAADAAVGFFAEHLRLTEGEWAGRPFVLEPWEENDIVRPLFGWKRPDGTRRYRRCYVWVPRKNGKTEIAAGISQLMLLGDGELGGQVFSIAADKDQARIVFNKAVAMVQWSEALSRHLTCFKTAIYCPALNASFKPLSGEPAGKHGLNMSGLVGDEIHEWPDGRLYTFVHQSSAARRQPLEFLISTAGERSGYGWETWQYCRKILDGTIDDPETLVVVYAADAEDDWTSPETWAKANPNLGVSVKLAYLEAECAKAKELPRLENDFKRYHLNLWTEQEVRWLPIERWDACADVEYWGGPWSAEAEAAVVAKLRGRRCFGGLDLASTSDTNSLKWVFPPLDDDPVWRVLCRFFVPQDRIAERSRRDRVPYDLWQRMGALIATPGNVADYAFIKEAIYADAEQFLVAGLAIDRWNATQLATELTAEGLPVVLFGQGFASMSAPSKELERLVLAGLIDHGGHPVLRWMARNVAIATDAAGNIKPAKDKSTEKIDGIVSTIMGIGIAAASVDEGPSVYETRGIIEIEV